MSALYEEILSDPTTRAAVKAQMIATMTGRGMAGVLERREATDRTEGKVKDELVVSDLRDLPDDELEERRKKLNLDAPNS